MKQILITAAVDFFTALAGTAGAATVYFNIKHRMAHDISVKIRDNASDAYRKIKENVKPLSRIKRAMKKECYLKEIYQGTAFLRNRIAAGKGMGITTDIILEELIHSSEELKYAYSKMLSMVRINERSAAVNEFAEITGLKEGKELARMIIQLDEIPEAEVYKSLLSFQKGMNESRITVYKKRDESLSDILYLPVMANIVIIMFNFLYVSYFMNQKELMAFLMQ